MWEKPRRESANINYSRKKRIISLYLNYTFLFKHCCENSLGLYQNPQQSFDQSNDCRIACSHLIGHFKPPFQTFKRKLSLKILSTIFKCRLGCCHLYNTYLIALSLDAILCPRWIGLWENRVRHGKSPHDPPKTKLVFEAEGCLPASNPNTEYIVFHIEDDDSISWNMYFTFWESVGGEMARGWLEMSLLSQHSFIFPRECQRVYNGTSISPLVLPFRPLSPLSSIILLPTRPKVSSGLKSFPYTLHYRSWVDKNFQDVHWSALDV